ncbi:MAG: hypothetical protein PHH70_04955 [Candidatus Gracilibacteria bacterium]|nr:hypothetical protein [Candidatus Gracilibacteria bacterium]
MAETIETGSKEEEVTPSQFSEADRARRIAASWGTEAKIADLIIQDAAGRVGILMSEAYAQGMAIFLPYMSFGKHEAPVAQTRQRE